MTPEILYELYSRKDFGLAERGNGRSMSKLMRDRITSYNYICIVHDLECPCMVCEMQDEVQLRERQCCLSSAQVGVTSR